MNSATVLHPTNNSLAISSLLSTRDFIGSTLPIYIILAVERKTSPISYILILRRSEEVLENDNEFQEIHGYLYDGIRTKTPLQKLYFAIFMVRRIFYLAIAFCGP